MRGHVPPLTVLVAPGEIQNIAWCPLDKWSRVLSSWTCRQGELEAPIVSLFIVSHLRRENIEKDIEVERRRAENPDVMEEDVDQVPCITRAHFEEVSPPGTQPWDWTHGFALPLGPRPKTETWSVSWIPKSSDLRVLAALSRFGDGAVNSRSRRGLTALRSHTCCCASLF